MLSPQLISRTVYKLRMDFEPNLISKRIVVSWSAIRCIGLILDAAEQNDLPAVAAAAKVILESLALQGLRTTDK
jgi:hypothetical protein